MYEDQEESPSANRKRQIQSSIRMTLNRDQIMTFVSGLHEVQMDMIELAVQKKARDGFPEANEVIAWIKARK
jgi:hypothetical protein